MDTSFAALVSLCSGATVQGGLLAGLFLAGAAGSVVHCAPMCGGFVLSQASDRIARVPAARLCEWRRLQSGLLLPYHLGRLTTYAILGAAAATSAAMLGQLPWLTGLSTALMVIAALVFLHQALRRTLGHTTRAGGVSSGRARGWSAALVWATHSIGREHAVGGYVLGLVLGLLPCSFLYGALFAAASAGRWDRGALAMLCFGLGTVPVLVVVAVLGQSAGRRWTAVAQVLAPGLMFWNALLLLMLAGTRVWL